MKIHPEAIIAYARKLSGGKLAMLDPKKTPLLKSVKRPRLWERRIIK